MFTSFYQALYELSQRSLFLPLIVILCGSIIVSFKTRFIQIRMIPEMFRLLFASQKVSKSEHTIHPRKALFTAMATTIGIGNIVSPIVAIGFGGPGALFGFLLATIFGSAMTFTEVTFAVSYRKRYENGVVKGGPMEYLRVALHPFFSYLYAFLTTFLLMAWTSSQSNQISVLISSFGVSRSFTGIFIACIVLFLLIGGIKRVGMIAEKLVPVMFLLYASAMTWILICNYAKLPATFMLIFSSAFSSKALAGAGVGYGFQKALRWGLAKGFFSNEAGLGTSTIPHSASSSSNPLNQGILSMVSVYTNGILCFMSGLAVLVTDAWLQPGIPFDISMATYVFSLYLPSFGVLVLGLCVFLFSFSTILGNSYNGAQCFRYVTKNRYIPFHYMLVAVALYGGAVSDVKYIWSIVDIFLIPVAIPHIIGIVVLLFKKPSIIRQK